MSKNCTFVGQKYFLNIFYQPKIFSVFGKVLMRPSHTVLQSLPVKAGAWIFFSARRNVLMAGNVSNGVLATQCPTQAS